MHTEGLVPGLPGIKPSYVTFFYRNRAQMSVFFNIFILKTLLGVFIVLISFILVLGYQFYKQTEEEIKEYKREQRN